MTEHCLDQNMEAVATVLTEVCKDIVINGSTITILFMLDGIDC